MHVCVCFGTWRVMPSPDLAEVQPTAGKPGVVRRVCAGELLNTYAMVKAAFRGSAELHAADDPDVCCIQRSNVLPAEVDVSRDFVTESSPSALRALFASWTLEECRQWCANAVSVIVSDHGWL